MENKKRFIDANEAKKIAMEHLSNPYEIISTCAVLDRTPTIDAEEVVHGRWIIHRKGQNNWCECSECNTVGSPFWKRCPVCEAKMNGGNEDG